MKLKWAGGLLFIVLDLLRNIDINETKNYLQWLKRTDNLH